MVPDCAAQPLDWFYTPLRRIAYEGEPGMLRVQYASYLDLFYPSERIRNPDELDESGRFPSQRTLRCGFKMRGGEAIIVASRFLF